MEVYTRYMVACTILQHKCIKCSHTENKLFFNNIRSRLCGVIARLQRRDIHIPYKVTGATCSYQYCGIYPVPVHLKARGALGARLRNMGTWMVLGELDSEPDLYS